MSKTFDNLMRALAEVKAHRERRIELPSVRIEIDTPIRPGDEIDWVAAGDVIRVIPPGKRGEAIDRESQLRLFDQATARLRQRPATQRQVEALDRGWNREDLYGRGRSH